MVLTAGIGAVATISIDENVQEGSEGFEVVTPVGWWWGWCSHRGRYAVGVGKFWRGK